MFLLRTTDLDVTEVCLAVGFTSLGTFSRMFSAVVGQSPSEYARHRHPARRTRLLHDGLDPAQHVHPRRPRPVERVEPVGFGEAGPHEPALASGA